MQGGPGISAENQPIADQEEDLPEDENEMKAIANKIAKQMSLEGEETNGSEDCGVETSNGNAATQFS